MAAIKQAKKAAAKRLKAARKALVTATAAAASADGEAADAAVTRVNAAEQEVEEAGAAAREARMAEVAAKEAERGAARGEGDTDSDEEEGAPAAAVDTEPPPTRDPGALPPLRRFGLALTGVVVRVLLPSEELPSAERAPAVHIIVPGPGKLNTSGRDKTSLDAIKAQAGSAMSRD